MVRCRDALLENDLFSFQVPFEFEPSKLALGPCHIALCVESKLLDYRFSVDNRISPLRTEVEVNLKREIKVSILRFFKVLYDNQII